jgi:hypothetical protein
MNWRTMMKTTAKPMTVRVPGPAAPRNPYAVAARLRRAGAHGGGGGAQRQRAQRELRAALRALGEGP